MVDPKQPPGGGIQVIGVGLGRTGTGSTMIALNKLGYKTFHMKEVRNDLKRFSTKWPEIYKKAEAGTITRADWDDVFGDYTATLDFPAAMFPRELHAAYPNAKYILTVRDDAKKWYDSTLSTIAKTKQFPFWHLTRLLRPPWVNLLKITDYFWATFFHGRFKEDGMAIYEAHNALCRQVIPAEQLLVFNVKEGWEPLCKFLGKEVPDEDYPYENEGKQMAAMFNSMNRFLVAQLVAYSAGIAGLAAVLAFKRHNIAALIRGLRN